ncbi:L-lactate permease [Tessaracoccus sp. OH4464_COT-324]|uniref:L-lactate permease n=1 Tax=Tessaracoccus sp. OH4464_COT-324 TaxID=2491059 RepID=UPI000F633E1E|nr:L-lactate permease [Tessaracoccus sp. OH4464_COT-324]RRD47964.1 L-lactate permease [Tessaracoccus sp. OH4464_COT-324]
MIILEQFTPDVNPLGSQWLSALVAVLPIVAMLVTLGVLRWKAHNAAIFSWGVALLVAIFAFKMPVITSLSASAQGFLYGLFPIVWILLTAIWMYEVTVASGRFEDLRRTFFLISDDPRVVGLIIAFCFGGLLEALAGYGAPVAITAAMLIAVGFSPVRAAMVALLANTVPVAFGAVGLPVVVAADVAQLDVMAISPITGRITAMLSLVVPFLILLVMDGRKGLKQCWPIGLVIGLSFGATKWVVSSTPLFNLTEMFAAVVSVAITLVFLRFWKPSGSAEVAPRISVLLAPEVEQKWVPKKASDGDAPELTGSRIFMALVPYIMVIVVFGIAAIPAIKSFLKSLDVSWAWPLLDGLMTYDGKKAAHQAYTLLWASSPGILLAFVALATGIVYRMSISEIFTVLGKNVMKMRFSALTIGFVVALAYVMGDSGQTLALGLFIAGAGAFYAALSPILGWIGTYVTGSDTSANILFSGLQSTVGTQIGEGSHLGVQAMRELLVGSNASGGVVGKMISPQSLTIAATSIGLAGAESVILRKVFKWSIVLLLLMCVITGLMSTPALSWLI